MIYNELKEKVIQDYWKDREKISIEGNAVKLF